MCQGEALEKVFVIPAAPVLVVVAGAFGDEYFLEMIVVEFKQAYGSCPYQTLQEWTQLVVFYGDQVSLHSGGNRRSR